MNDSLRKLQDKINYEKTFACVQCGYCLPACPTYETMKKETHSPRGRINLVKQFAEGKLDINVLQDPIDKCLGCNACTVVCPSDVEYNKILEGAKQVLEEQQPKTKKQKIAEKLLFEDIFPSRKWMKRVGDLTWFYQASGLKKFAEKTGLAKVAPLSLDQFSQVLPNLPSPSERRRRLHRIPAKGKSRIKVGFFTGCIMDSIFFEINQKTIDLLTLAGAEVVIPEMQTCCGALHAHTGKIGHSRLLAKKNIEAFEAESVDYIINNAGGCGARLIEYEELFDDDPEWRERAKTFSNKTRDISEILVELDRLTFTQPIAGPVTYQASCHMLNVQKVVNAPLKLIKEIPNIDYREMEGADRCCGSAGIYNIVNFEDSMKILDNKMIHMKETQAKIIVTTNPGCLLQMKLGIKRENLASTVRALHLVELLHEARPVQK